MIPIPYLPKAKAVTLQRCIETTARETGYDEHAVLIIMSRFWEALADEVSKGREVRIPGFGMFAPTLIQNRGGAGNPRGGDPTPRCKPTFAPTSAFRQQVAYGAPPSKLGNHAVKNYNRNHMRRDDGGRVFTAQQKLREKIEASLGYARVGV